MIAPLRDFATRFFGLFRRRSLESRIEEELRFHLEMQIEANRKNGMSPEDALNAALRSLGGVDQAKERHRDVRSLRLVEDFCQDVRFGIRMLCRKPGYAIASVLILALAIGPNTAFFSVMKGVMFNYMPYPEPDRLVQINATHALAGVPFGVSYPDYLDFQKRNRSFENMAVFENAKVDLTGTGDPERVRAIRTSSSLFTVLKRAPLHGRVFLPNEDRPEANAAVILSYGLWLSKFAGDAGVVGKTVSVDRVPHIVVGVMPADFVFTESRYDLLLPLHVNPAEAPRQAREYYPVARLKPGVSIEQARADLSSIAAALAREQVFTNYGVGVFVQKLSRNYLSNNLVVLMQSLYLSVTFVLLIACANISTLLLARATGRKKEIAIRASIGCARSRLLRQLLTESTLLAISGGLVGIFLTSAWLKLIVALAPPDMPNRDTISIDRISLVYTAVIVIVSSLAFGIVPALRSTGRRAMEALKEESRATAGRARHRLLNAFLVSEAAMAAMLLIFTGLMIRSFRNQITSYPGFERTNLLSAFLVLPESKYGPPAHVNAFVGDVLAKLGNCRGIQTAAATMSHPMDGRYASYPFSIQGQPYVSGNQPPTAALMIVTPDYFRTMRIPILQGRPFSESDIHGSPVAIVSESMVKRYMADLPNPVGRRIKLGDAASAKLKWTEIVGVVGDVRDLAVRTIPQSQIYLSYGQYPQRDLALVVRTDRDPLEYAAALQSLIRSADPEQPISAIRSMEQILGESISEFRIVSELMSLLSIFALALASFGIYSVVSYAVSERTQEIGIRMAFGAQRGDICRMILHRGLVLLGVGLLLGVAGALASMRFLQEYWLVGVTSRDLISYAGSGIVLASAGVLAMLVPVHRAMCVDPMDSIRHG
jgi:putative ABC transport system permease protein